jgi:SPFH domain / Band 7 family
VGKLSVRNSYLKYKTNDQSNRGENHARITARSLCDSDCHRLAFNSIKVLREYERGVIFRLGRLLPHPKGPGLIFVFWPIDRIVRVSFRTVTLEVPTQDVITSDNVSVKVNAVVYFRVMNAIKAIVEVENFLYATSQLAQTTLRSVLGEVAPGDPCRLSNKRPRRCRPSAARKANSRRTAQR